MFLAPFAARKKSVLDEYALLLERDNTPEASGNGIFARYRYPVVTAAHVPPSWRYDFSEERNPFFQERLGVGAVFNAGALLHEGRYLIMARVEGWDRKSFFAIAESPNGVEDRKSGV